MSSDERESALENIFDPSDLPLLQLMELLYLYPKLFQNIKLREKILNFFHLINKISDFHKETHSTNIAIRKSCIEIIGTLNIIPSLMLLFSSFNPIRNRDFIRTAISSALLMAGVYIYLINFENFPNLEYLNVLFLIITSLSLLFLYPWDIE